MSDRPKQGDRIAYFGRVGTRLATRNPQASHKKSRSTLH